MENFDFKPHIVESITELFDSMLSMPVALSDSEPPDISETNRIVGTVNFTGGVIGALNVQVNKEFAVTMAASMQGVEVEEIEGDEEIKDLIAEFSNIIGGNLKSTLNDSGYPCGLSTPSITYGTDFSIESLNLERFERFLFLSQQDLITVEVGAKEQQGAAKETIASPADTGAAPKKIDTEKIKALDLKSKVSGSIIDVFDTMLSMALEATDSAEFSNPEGIRNVGTVSFTGDVIGQISIQMADEFSRISAASMLDMDVEELEADNEVKDMLGELSNILGGSLKSAFTDLGLICEISTPAFTTGKDFIIESFDMKHYERFAFRHENNIVFLELGIKYADELQIDKPDEEASHIPVNEPLDESTDQPEKQQEPESQPVMQQQASDLEAPAADRVEKPNEAQQQPEVVSPPTDEMQTVEDFDLNLILDIPLEITVELGRARVQIQELLELGPGSTITLSKLEGEPVNILANDKLIARGEVVLQNKKYGIRITEITSRMNRIKSLH